MKFALYPTHKTVTKASWKNKGLLVDELELEIIYNRYINAEYCELCNKEFLKRNNRQMEHNHETGQFRNICCNRCNLLKSDVKLSSKNTSGFKGICKQQTPNCKNEFSWKFQAYVGGKQRKIKQCGNLEYLVNFAKKWKLENNYHT